MLKYLLFWSLLQLSGTYNVSEPVQVAYTLNKGEVEVLAQDHESGCKVLLFRPKSYYFYGDSCLVVPKNFNLSSYTDVYIRTSKISRVSKGDFDEWSGIESLSMEVNTELKIIEDGVFNKLDKLENLTISNNYQMETLGENVFEGLVNLKELTFTNNNIINLKKFIYSARPGILPNLIKLDLSENYLIGVNITDFEDLKNANLSILYMTFCSLVYIHPKSLSPLKQLNFLNLSNNNLNSSTVSDLMVSINKTSQNFTSLSISANLLHKHPFRLLKTISSTNIKHLDLSENHFDPMGPGSIPVMPNLEYLILSGMKAINFNNGTLTQNLVPNLKMLDLSKNRFTGVMDGFLLPNLNILDVSENTCESCYTTSLFKISDYQLGKMENLEILNLSKNNIYHIKKFMFANLFNIKELYVSNCSIYRIEDFSFFNLTNLLYLDLSKNNIENFALNENTFEGLVNLKSLSLDSNKINSLNNKVFKKLENLTKLSIIKNTIVELYPETFSLLSNLQFLDLSYNNILEYETQIFKYNKNLKYLILKTNLISEITEQMLKDFSDMIFVDLSENPLYCTCSSVKMIQNYIYSINLPNIDLNLIHINDTYNVCFSPRQWGNTDFIDFINYNLKTNFCDNYIFVTSVIIIVLILVSLFIFVVYCLRFHIRYWVFLLRQTMRHSFPKKKPPPDGKYKYDAFVSYSQDDRSFVVRLVSMLESQEPFLNLCVFERDFDVGGIITENVLNNLSASKRTILILSDSFARSTWCLWEMKIAQHKWLFFKDDENEPLIIIKIGEIMDKHMTPTLRYLIKTRIYLQWNSDPKKQKIFWQKLRSVLSKPTMN